MNPTFLVVTFAWSFALALLVLYRLFFRCVHKWELVDKTEIPSKFSEMKKQGWMPQGMFSSDYMSASRIKILLCIRCTACGGVKVIRENND